MTLKLFVHKRRLRWEQSAPLVGGTAEFDRFSVEFDEEWEGLVKLVVFRNGTHTAQLIYTGPTALPARVCGPGELYIACHGFRSDPEEPAVLRTVRMDRPIRLWISEPMAGDPAGQFTPTVFEQVMAASGRALEAADRAEQIGEALKQARDRGEFDGNDGLYRITLTESGGTVTADRTFEEIRTAMEAGFQVWCLAPDGMTRLNHLSTGLFGTAEALSFGAAIPNVEQGTNSILGFRAITALFLQPLPTVLYAEADVASDLLTPAYHIEFTGDGSGTLTVSDGKTAEEIGAAYAKKVPMQAGGLFGQLADSGGFTGRYTAHLIGANVSEGVYIFASVQEGKTLLITYTASANTAAARWVTSGGGESNLLVVTAESGTASHTPDEIRAFLDGGGACVLALKSDASTTMLQFSGWFDGDTALFDGMANAGALFSNVLSVSTHAEIAADKTCTAATRMLPLNGSVILRLTDDGWTPDTEYGLTVMEAIVSLSLGGQVTFSLISDEATIHLSEARVNGEGPTVTFSGVAADNGARMTVELAADGSILRMGEEAPLAVDATLSVEGAAADAKAVGDALQAYITEVDALIGGEA